MPDNPSSPSEGLRAASRLLALASDPADGGRALLAAIASEAQHLLGVPHAAVLPARQPEPGEFVVPLPGHVLVLSAAPTDNDLTTAFATAAAAALEQQRAMADQARHAASQQALTRAAKTLNESLDLSTLLGRICEEATLVIEADSAAIYSGSPGEGLTVRAAYGLPPEVLDWKMPAGGGLAGKVLRDDRPALAEDYQAVAELPPDSPFASIRSCVAAPIHWGGEARGVLSVGYRRPSAVDESHMDTLAAFAELAAVAFQNASAHAGLARAARTDTLTGCLNHAALHDGLQREIERAERAENAALSLILLDLDDFKSINDEHGHLIGDEVLRRVGHALRSTTRPYDLAARYGGDEFALVAVGADEEQAGEIATRALERLAAALGDLGGVATGSATAGVAEWSSGTSSSELIARADRAMLHAKREGARGRVHAFSDLRRRPSRASAARSRTVARSSRPSRPRRRSSSGRHRASTSACASERDSSRWRTSSARVCRR